MKNTQLNLTLAFILLFNQVSFSQQACLGNAIQLNGTSDYVNINSLGNFYIGNTMTIEAWVYPTDTTDTRAIITRGNNTNSEGVSFGIYHGKIWAGGNNGYSGWNNTFVGSVPTNQWTHIAASYIENSGEIKIYLNGNLISTSNRYFKINGFNYNSYIGRNQYTSLQFFAGIIDELRVWNTIRTVTEIKANLNNQLNGNESGLLAYYNMNRTGVGSGLLVQNNCNNTINQFNGTTYSGTISPTFQPSIGTLPDIIPSSILGISTVAQGDCNLTYSIQQLAFATNYQWAYSGENVTTTPNLNELKVTYGLLATSGLISIQVSNSCNSTQIKVLPISVNPNPCPQIRNIDIATPCNLYYRSRDIIESNGHILSGGKIDYLSNTIILKPGFTAELNSVFKATPTPNCGE